MNAVGRHRQERKEAVSQLRELQDVLQLKEAVSGAVARVKFEFKEADGRLSYQLQEDTHRALMLSQEESRTLTNKLKSAENVSRDTALEVPIADQSNTFQQLASLQAHLASLPISDAALLSSYERLKDMFEHIDDALSCAICYSPFSRAAEHSAHSLACGHTFCGE